MLVYACVFLCMPVYARVCSCILVYARVTLTRALAGKANILAKKVNAVVEKYSCPKLENFLEGKTTKKEKVVALVDFYLTMPDCVDEE